MRYLGHHILKGGQGPEPGLLSKHRGLAVSGEYGESTQLKARLHPPGQWAQLPYDCTSLVLLRPRSLLMMHWDEWLSLGDGLASMRVSDGLFWVTGGGVIGLVGAAARGLVAACAYALSTHSRLPAAFRELINGIAVTDENNNELGLSKVSLGSPGRAGWC